jgi:hypothetical protein
MMFFDLVAVLRQEPGKAGDIIDSLASLIPAEIQRELQYTTERPVGAPAA